MAEAGSSGDPGGIRSALAEVIAEAKRAAGLSQRQIAARVGVNQAAVSNWLRKVATPSIERVIDLDRAFGLRPGTLLERAGVIEPRSTEAAIASDESLNDRDKQVLQAFLATESSPQALLDQLASSEPTVGNPPAVVLFDIVTEAVVTALASASPVQEASWKKMVAQRAARAPVYARRRGIRTVDPIEADRYREHEQRFYRPPDCPECGSSSINVVWIDDTSKTDPPGETFTRPHELECLRCIKEAIPPSTTMALWRREPCTTRHRRKGTHQAS